MKVAHYEQVESQQVDMPGASGCRVRWLVGEKDGAPTFAMRQFDFEHSFSWHYYHLYLICSTTIRITFLP